jgi:large subunit ribosomal protein L25
MTDTTSIVARPRDVIGKSSKRLSRDGMIPAVLYGKGREAMSIAIDQHDFEMFMQQHATGATLVTVEIEGDEPVNAVIKDVQHSPVKGAIIHVDFLEIRMDEKLQAAVSLNIVGDSVGVKEGGVLMQNMREVMVEALPTDLPDAIDVDITELELGDTLQVEGLIAPAAVEIIDDPKAVICSVTVPTEEPTEEEIAELLGEEGEEVPELGEEVEEGEEGAEGEAAPADDEAPSEES